MQAYWINEILIIYLCLVFDELIMIMAENIRLGLEHNKVSWGMWEIISGFAVGAVHASLDAQLDILEMVRSNISLQIHRIYVDRAKKAIINPSLYYIFVIEMFITLCFVGSA